jgi:hypothetical protein
VINLVQIGNLHIGKTDNIDPPSISIQEAAYLWDFLVGRYKCLEESKLYLCIVKDPDFKGILTTGIVLLLEKQVELVEKELEKYKIPLPYPSPKSFKHLENTGIELQDEFMFSQIFEGCQSYIDVLARMSRSMVTSDSLRDMFSDFLKRDLLTFDQFCKYGKQKGWLQTPPMYNVHLQ